MTPNPDLQRLADTSAAARPAALWDWLADVTRPQPYDRETPIRSDLLAHAAALNPNGPVWLKARTRLDALAPALDWMAVEGRSFGRIAADTVTGRGPFPPGLLDALDPDAWSAWHQRLTTEMQATEPDKLESPEAVQAWHRRGAKIIGKWAADGVLATVLRVEADRLPGLVESGQPYEPALSPLLQDWYAHAPRRVGPKPQAHPQPILWLPRQRQPEGAGVIQVQTTSGSQIGLLCPPGLEQMAPAQVLPQQWWHLGQPPTGGHGAALGLGFEDSRLVILRREVERNVLDPFRLHGWSAEIERGSDREDCIEIAAWRGAVATRIAVLYISTTSNARSQKLSKEVERIFFHGEPYMLDSFARSVTIPVQPLRDFFPFLVDLNKQVEPDCSIADISRRPPKDLHLTSENPLDAVLARLQQFTSPTLARKLVERRAEEKSKSLSIETIASKANGIAYAMRGALDYIVPTPRDALNRRVVSLYYGAMALAQAEMLALPLGPTDLDQVEAMTTRGHGLFALPMPQGGFADLHVGVLKSGFFGEWMKFLRHDTSGYPQKRPKKEADLEGVAANMYCSLQDLFASMPEIDDLFGEVFDGPPGWISVAYDPHANGETSASNTTARMVGSTYAQFIARSGKVPVDRLKSAGWPIAEVQQVDDYKGTGTVFRGRVDHAGHDLWWDVLPTFTSPFDNSIALLLFPTVGGLWRYRTIAVMTLYALSIMVRYMPSAWRRIEGGDEDQYLALVRASLAVWERVLPEYFLASIAGETVRTSQPGRFLA